MTQDEIIEMAKELSETFACRMCDENGDTHGEELYAMGIEDFVEVIKLVTAKEREACASICFQQIARWTDDRARFAAGECSKAIRARGEA